MLPFLSYSVELNLTGITLERDIFNTVLQVHFTGFSGLAWIRDHKLTVVYEKKKKRILSSFK
jgi:hypothetical protein